MSTATTNPAEAYIRTQLLAWGVPAPLTSAATLQARVTAPASAAIAPALARIQSGLAPESMGILGLDPTPAAAMILRSMVVTHLSRVSDLTPERLTTATMVLDPSPEAQRVAWMDWSSFAAALRVSKRGDEDILATLARLRRVRLLVLVGVGQDADRDADPQFKALLIDRAALATHSTIWTSTASQKLISDRYAGVVIDTPMRSI